MTIEEYFNDWLRVIDRKELDSVVNKLLIEYKKKSIYPKQSDIFKAFHLCSYRDCIVVFIGLDPYPQKGVATGILFGNNNNTLEESLSPSLKVIKNSVIDLHKSHNLLTFDPTLESWAKQGILMLNSALTVEENKVGSHTMLWRPFISKLLINMSKANAGIIYVLFGNTAHTFEPYIGKLNHIFKVKHPSYYARLNKDMPSDIFYEINRLVKEKYNYKINWYNEEN